MCGVVWCVLWYGAWCVSVCVWCGVLQCVCVVWSGVYCGMVRGVLVYVCGVLVYGAWCVSVWCVVC